MATSVMPARVVTTPRMLAAQFEARLQAFARGIAPRSQMRV
jgi:hypothetical protein